MWHASAATGSHWGLRWSCLWGHVARERCAKVGLRRRANAGGRRARRRAGGKTPSAADLKRGPISTQDG
eukprot:1509475-Pyramimonas_sp.AAC.1